MANRRALLIGINRYQIPGADLRGCVNDVKNMEAVLVELCGFRPADIETLTDVDATKKAMQVPQLEGRKVRLEAAFLSAEA